MLLHLTEKSEEPLHSQISRQLTSKIIKGDLIDGSELDSIRKLATSQRVSINTVKRAYQELEQHGLIFYQPGKGFYIASLTPQQKQAIAKQQRWRSHSLLNAVETYSLEERLIDEELEMARKIQADLFPKELPDNKLFSVPAYSSPSKMEGGDFYDFFQIDEHHHGIVIADAFGKAMPAALLISQFQQIIKSEFN